MRKLTFLVGLGVGVVLGSRAGRGPYEQLVNATRRTADRPGVRFSAGVITAKVAELVRGRRAA